MIRQPLTYSEIRGAPCAVENPAVTRLPPVGCVTAEPLHAVGTGGGADVADSMQPHHSGAPARAGALLPMTAEIEARLA